MSKRDITRRQLLERTAAAGAGVALASAIGARPARADAPDAKADKGKPTKPAKADEAPPQVPRRVLGKTGKQIPILLVGTAMSLDQKFDPKLAEAFRYGVDYIDTAAVYAGGTSETAVGNFAAKAKVRDKLWITSKSMSHSVDGFEKTFRNSLEELKTDYIDLYFLHALQDKDPLSKDMGKLVERLKKEGSLRHFGFSCHHGNVHELLEEAAKHSWVDAVMFRYNFRTYGHKELNKAMDAAHKAGVGLIAMKTQGSSASFGDSVKKFEKTGKWNKYQAVLKAVWADERISAAVSHMDTLEKVHENVAAALDREKLTRLELRELHRYAAATRSTACDGCDHLCNPAVDAPVRIGDTLRYLMYHDSYNDPDTARTLYRQLPAAARDIAHVDFRRAAAACPHDLDIPTLMRRAHTLLG